MIAETARYIECRSSRSRTSVVKVIVAPPHFGGITRLTRTGINSGRTGGIVGTFTLDRARLALVSRVAAHHRHTFANCGKLDAILAPDWIVATLFAQSRTRKIRSRRRHLRTKAKLAHGGRGPDQEKRVQKLHICINGIVLPGSDRDEGTRRPRQKPRLTSYYDSMTP